MFEAYRLPAPILGAALSLIVVTGLAAQPAPAPSPPDNPRPPEAAAPIPRGFGLGPGMMGPGMMGPGMMHGPAFWNGRYSAPCDPAIAGMAGWRVDQIERVVKPTDAQRAAFNDLRTASTKAAEGLASACPRELPVTSAARFAFMEQRMEAMLQAIKTVRPAFDAFYSALNDEQKARLDSVGPRRWGWRWRHG